MSEKLILAIICFVVGIGWMYYAFSHAGEKDEEEEDNG